MRITKWYILAGGSATRWKCYQGVENKCNLKIDNETLLERTQRLLKENGIEDITIVEKGYNSKREAFEGIAREAKQPFGILLGDCYYTEAIIKDAVNRYAKTWIHYYNCLPNPWTGCTWEEGYIHLVPDWEWWANKMEEFNKKVDSGEIEFSKDFQIDRYLRGYSPSEYKWATLDEHDIFWADETDDFDYPEDYDKFMERHKRNKNGLRKNKLSIIIPHYNTPEQLMRLLDNLKAQIKSHPHTEVIVVDDGSDFELNWLRGSYKWVKTIFQPNRGVSSARNTGLMASTGKYIAFVDSDDSVTDDYVHTIYTLMENNDCDYILFPFIVVANNGDICYPRDELIGNYAVWSWAFRWECINGERFDETLNVAEDVDWLRRVVTKDKKRYVSSKPIYKYDWNSNLNSLSKRYNNGDLPKERS